MKTVASPKAVAWKIASCARLEKAYEGLERACSTDINLVAMHNLNAFSCKNIPKEQHIPK